MGVLDRHRSSAQISRARASRGHEQVEDRHRLSMFNSWTGTILILFVRPRRRLIPGSAAVGACPEPEAASGCPVHSALDPRRIPADVGGGRVEFWTGINRARSHSLGDHSRGSRGQAPSSSGLRFRRRSIGSWCRNRDRLRRDRRIRSIEREDVVSLKSESGSFPWPCHPLWT